MTRLGFLAAVLAVAAAALSTGCGYQVGGQGDLIPKTVKSIAIRPFRNLTIYYKLNDEIPKAISSELKARTKYEVINDPNVADVVIEGQILNVLVIPAIYDATSGKATSVDVVIHLNLRVVERATNKTLFEKAGQEYRDSYEIAEDPSKYFDEADFSWARMSRTIGSRTVSLLLEAF
jgi:hypothetical protein